MRLDKYFVVISTMPNHKIFNSNKSYHLSSDYCGLGNTILFTFADKEIEV